jgi:LysM repeat protein
MAQEYDIHDPGESLTTREQYMADTRKPKANFSDVTPGGARNLSSSKRGDFSDVQGGSSSTAPTPSPTSRSQSYTVVKGDSLSKIAKRVLGDASLWPRIYEANRSIISDPDLIHPGQVLTIPVP